MRIITLVLCVCIVGMCSAATWNIPSSIYWYMPTSYDYMDKDYSWAVVDKNGHENIINFNESGDNGAEVINSIQSTVKSVFENLVSLSRLTIVNARRLEEVDQEFFALSQNLDWVMAQLTASIDNIQVDIETLAGTVETSWTREPTVIDKSTTVKETKYVATGFPDPDNKTLEIKKEEGKYRYAIKNFATGGGCAENLKELMTKSAKDAERSHHSIITRYDNGGGPTLHYLPLGNRLEAVAGVKVYDDDLDQDGDGKVNINNLVKSITANGETLSPNSEGVVNLGNLNTITQNVLTVSGTQGAGGSGRAVRFESMPDSNVKIDVGTDVNGVIVVKIGVYYQQ